MAVTWQFSVTGVSHMINLQMTYFYSHYTLEKVMAVKKKKKKKSETFYLYSEC